MHAFPLRKRLNIIFSHHACNSSKQITCSTVAELVSMSKALENIICFILVVILFDKSLELN